MEGDGPTVFAHVCKLASKGHRIEAQGLSLPFRPLAWQRLNGVSSSRCPVARQFDPETMSSPLPRDYCERRSAPRRPTTRSATRVECIDKKGPPSSALRPAARRGASPDPISHGPGISFGRVLRGAAPFLSLFCHPAAQESY